MICAKTVGNLASLKSEVAVMKQSISENVIDKTIEDKLSVQADASVKELNERDTRKLNLVFLNVPESTKVEGEDRKNGDMEALREILGEIECNVPLANVVKLGAKSEEIRPTRAKVASV